MAGASGRRAGEQASAVRFGRRAPVRAGRRCGPVLMLALNLVLLGLGLAALRAASGDMPALDASLRIAVPGGSWRPADGFGLYNRGNYLLERTTAFVGAARTGEDPRPLMVAALRLAVGAIEAAPADAYPWTLIAGVAAANGVDEFARIALAQSRALAPNTVGVALDRVRLAGLQSDLDDPSARAAVIADLELSRARRGAELDALLAEAPALGERLRRLLAAADADPAAAAVLVPPAPAAPDADAPAVSPDAPAASAPPPARAVGPGGGRAALTRPAPGAAAAPGAPAGSAAAPAPAGAADRTGRLPYATGLADRAAPAGPAQGTSEPARAAAP